MGDLESESQIRARGRLAQSKILSTALLSNLMMNCLGLYENTIEAVGSTRFSILYSIRLETYNSSFRSCQQSEPRQGTSIIVLHGHAETDGT